MLGIGMGEEGSRRIVDHPLAPLGAAGNLFAHEALDCTVTVKAAEIFEPRKRSPRYMFSARWLMKTNAVQSCLAGRPNIAAGRFISY
jgi:hypothetical protein